MQTVKWLVSYLFDQVCWAFTTIVVVHAFGRFLRWASANHTPASLVLLALGASLVVAILVMMLYMNNQMAARVWVAAGDVPLPAPSARDYRLPRVFDVIYPSIPERKHAQDGRIDRPPRSGAVVRLPGWLFPWGGPGPVSLILMFLVVLGAVLVAALLVAASLLNWRTAIRTYNFAVSSGVILIPMAAATLRPSVLRLQTWEILKETWMKFPTFPSVTVIGFGGLHLAADSTIFAALRSGIGFSQLTTETLGLIFGGTIAFWAGAGFATLLGGVSKPNKDSHIPILAFSTAFMCAWMANAGLYTLFVDGVLLTWCAYL